MNKKKYMTVTVLILGLLALGWGLPAAGTGVVDASGIASESVVHSDKADAAAELAVQRRGQVPSIPSLKTLSIDRLRGQSFSSTLAIEKQLGDDTGSSAYSQFYGPPYYNTYMASYRSDGLRVYSRVDLPPTEMPENGYPVIIFAHGWVGVDGAPGYGFNYAANSYYGDILDAYVKAGFILLMPGFRGHGTVNDVPAEGLEYIQVYDNGSYLSPIFYGIDILNLLGGVASLEEVDWQAWGAGELRVDTSRIYLTGHSQDPGDRR